MAYRKRKKRRKQTQSEVELNLAAMLDMAFQLLTFFILTFRPSPIEGQVMLRMPPPQPVTAVVGGQQAGSDESNTNPVQGLTTLVITVAANASGNLQQIRIGESTMGAAAALDRRLGELIGDPGSGFDQVIIQVDSRLRYDALMEVIDVCSRQTLPSGEKLTKLSFVELPTG
jgi:biopolymer transport protein ExbD